MSILRFCIYTELLVCFHIEWDLRREDDVKFRLRAHRLIKGHAMKPIAPNISVMGKMMKEFIVSLLVIKKNQRSIFGRARPSILETKKPPSNLKLSRRKCPKEGRVMM